MSPKTQRVNFILDVQLRDEILEYRFSRKRGTMSDVYRELLEKGLAVSKGQDAALSQNAMELAAAYDRLDVYGRIALKETADREQKRMEAQRQEEAQKGLVRRPLAARNGSEPLDLSKLEPISADEIDQTEMDI